MKKIKNFEAYVNESDASMSIPTDPAIIRKEAEKTIGTIESICKGIISAKTMQDNLKTMETENKELATEFKKYFELATDASKLMAAARKNGISKDTRKAADQLRALLDLEEELREGFENLKTLQKKTKEAFDKAEKTDEGILPIIGNFLRNLLTGQWVVNLMKTAKQNLKDAHTDMYKVQDVFDIKEY